jgi:TPR repeat protein
MLWRAREVRRLVDLSEADLADPAVREREASADALAARAAQLGVDAAVVEVALKLFRAPIVSSDDERRAAVAQVSALADREQVDALLALGVLHREGVGGVRADLPLAERLLRVAALKGHLRAYRNLAVVLFRQGRDEEAVAALRRGAEAGDSRAEFELSNALRFGRHVPRPDPKEGETWLRRSAAAGFRRAQLELAQLLFDEHRHDEWPEAMRLVQDAAAELSDAKRVLARIRIYGAYRQSIDLQEGERLLRDLASKGDPQASSELGEAYLTGLWVQKDPVAGVRLLDAAAKAGDSRARDLLRLHHYLMEHPRDNSSR